MKMGPVCPIDNLLRTPRYAITYPTRAIRYWHLYSMKHKRVTEKRPSMLEMDKIKDIQQNVILRALFRSLSRATSTQTHTNTPTDKVKKRNSVMEAQNFGPCIRGM